MKHAPLAPSSAHIWSKCSGWLVMRDLLSPSEIEGETDATREGTAAHYVLERMLKKEQVEGHAPNGVAITPEMEELAAELVYEVKVAEDRCGGSLIIEETLNSIDAIHKDCWGTADIVLVDQQNKILTVWDYKYGHRYVDVYENDQLIIYAIGWAFDAGIIDNIDEWRVNMVIYQPRCYSAQSMHRWEIEGSQLNSHIERLHKAAEACYTRDVQCTTGDHCRYCPAAIICSSNQDMAERCLDISEMHHPQRPDNNQLSVELTVIDKAIQRLQDRRRSLGMLAEMRIAAGENIPQYDVVPSSSPRKKWKKETQSEAAIILGSMGIDVKYGVSIDTPGTIAKKGIDLVLLESYIEETEQRLALKQVDQKSYVRIFGNREK